MKLARRSSWLPHQRWFWKMIRTGVWTPTMSAPSLRRWVVYRSDDVDDQQLVRAQVFKYIDAFKL
jgi:hypothetical protein